MSEINQETLERLITNTENLLAALPVLASAAAMSSDTTTSMINYADVVGFGDTSDPAISHLPEIISYEQVYLIKPNDYIIGGANGIANLQARALVGRTNYLKKQLENLQDKVDEINLMPGEEETRYTEIIQRLNSLDISVLMRQLSQLERQNMLNALAMKSAGLEVDENNLIIEVFQNGTPTTIDLTNAEIVSVIRGDDSVDITDVKNLIEGGVYIITDGETSEEVQIKENLGTIENGWRILFVNDVVNNYKNGKAKLYRSNMKISDGKAYGGGINRTQTWNAGIDFSGTNGESEIVAATNFSNGLGFELEGATVDSNGHIVFGEESVGIALTENGWARVDAEGDDLNV